VPSQSPQHEEPVVHDRKTLTADTARMLAEDAPPPEGDARATRSGLPSIRDAAPRNPWNSAPRPPPTSPETGGERSGTAGRGGRRRLRSGECAVQERFGAGSWHGRGVGIPSGRDDGYGGFRLTLKSQPPVQMACKYILHPNMYVKHLQQLV
jgi:hypothetical protein